MQDLLAIRRAAMNLLARRDHSRYELQQKLQPRFPDKAAIKTAIAQLEEDGLQSDQRFAESFVRWRAQRGYGADRVQQELAQKGIGAEDIAKAFDANEIDWQQILMEQSIKKYGNNKPADLNDKAKRTRFLISRGFSYSEINQLWRS